MNDLAEKIEYTTGPLPSSTTSQPAPTIPTPSRPRHAIDMAEWPVAQLPLPVLHALAATALKARLAAVKDPAAAYREMLAGAVPGRTPARPKPLDARRKAVALAWADEAADAAKEADKTWRKFLPGGKPSADFAVMLENAEQRAAGATKEVIAAEHGKRTVRHHYVDLTATP